MSEDFFEDLGKNISKVAGDMVDKTGEFVESTKIKFQISSEEKVIEKGYRDIGEILYKQHMDGQPICEEAEKICEDILAHEDKINALKQDLATLKGKQVCPNCGEHMDKDATFCSKCGTTVTPVDAPADTTDADTDIIDTVEAAAEEAKEKVATTVDGAKEAAKDVASDVKYSAKDVAADLKDVAADAKDAASHVVDDVKDKVEDVKDKVKDE